MDIALFPEDLLHFSRTHNPQPPIHLGRRYDRAGTFQPEPGNTIVCHLIKDSPYEQAIIDARARYLAMPEAGQFAFTPISSLHMTLFQGIIEYRRRMPFWPADIPLDTPISEMTEIFFDRLKSFPVMDPFRVQVSRARPVGLTLEGAEENDRQAMKAWRDAFADILGYRHPDHDSYEFHITFCYVIDRLEDNALPGWQRMLDGVATELRERIPVIELRPPAFCTFEDMNHFEERLVFDFAS